MNPTDLIASGYRMSQAVIHRMVADFTPDEFHHQPLPGANSAAWIVGHLAVSLRRTAERLGATDLPAVAPELTAVMTQTGKPASDQAGLLELTQLAGPAELLKLFDACAEKVVEAVKRVPEAALGEPPAQRSPFATTYAEALLFGALHVTMHSGQLSAVRRSLGKPPLA